MGCFLLILLLVSECDGSHGVGTKSAVFAFCGLLIALEFLHFIWLILSGFLSAHAAYIQVLKSDVKTEHI